MADPAAAELYLNRFEPYRDLPSLTIMPEDVALLTVLNENSSLSTIRTPYYFETVVDDIQG